MELHEAVKLLRETPLERLINDEYLEELLPQLGLNDEEVHEYPSHLFPYCGQGLKSWQYPIQFAKYLVWISDLSLHSYAEIGVRHGGTFIITLEFLRRINSDIHAIAVDHQETEPFRQYLADFSDDRIEYIIRDSSDLYVRDYFTNHRADLVFIDGDHSYEGCLSDYLMVKNSAQYIAVTDHFSDVCPGVKQFWEEIKHVMPDDRLTEFKDQYEEVQARTGRSYMGIGMVELP
jgi:cephalosporin hydroxylase